MGSKSALAEPGSGQLGDFDPILRGLGHRSGAGTVTKTKFQVVQGLENVFLACRSRIKSFPDLSDPSNLTAKPFSGPILLNLGSKSAQIRPGTSQLGDVDPVLKGLGHRSGAGTVTKTEFQVVQGLENVFLACKSRIKPFAEVSDLSHLTAKPFHGPILLNLGSKSALTEPQSSQA